MSPPPPPPAFLAPSPLRQRACTPPPSRSRLRSPPPSPRVQPRTPSRRAVRASAARPVITVLDYGAGNVRSLHNALQLLGVDVQYATHAHHIRNAQRLIFPGVGSFGAAMENLRARHFDQALRQYVLDDRPFLGICLGLHTLFERSEESDGCDGLGVFRGEVRRFVMPERSPLTVPHIGWNSVSVHRPLSVLQQHAQRFYFVHSFCVAPDVLRGVAGVNVATATHGQPFVAALQRGNVVATQFHPEKSGAEGLRLLRDFVHARGADGAAAPATFALAGGGGGVDGALAQGLAKRVVACLDVRENDAGDLVVTKGDQYDVREAQSRRVRNLGKPVALAKRYFEQGADEICFLNITSFRGEPVNEAPMIEVLRQTSRCVFVPLCIGGGIRDYVDKQGTRYSALDVAAMYFRAGADKVSLGSDAVYAAERFWKHGKDGTSSIERISYVYGAQAVVVSVDPCRVYVADGESCNFSTVRLEDGRRCWYQCTVKGGRERRQLDVVQLATAVEALGAGEILLNSMDQDGQKNGFDEQLVRLVRDAVSIPVIASSGAGCAAHFTTVFQRTGVEAALAAGVFHRAELTIADVKRHMLDHGTRTRVGARLHDVLDVADVV